MRALQPRSLVVLLLISLGVATSGQFLAALFGGASRGPDRHSDFLTYYVAARLLRSGDSPYDLPAQSETRREAIGQESDEGADVFYFYPPPFLLFVLPLTFFSPGEANLVWTLGQVLAVCTACGVLLGRSLSGWTRVLVLVWSLSWLPVVVALKFGQVSLLLLLAFLALAHAVHKKRHFAAGAWCWVLALKPALLLLPGAFLMLAARWRSIAVACILSCAASPPDSSAWIC